MTNDDHYEKICKARRALAKAVTTIVANRKFLLFGATPILGQTTESLYLVGEDAEHPIPRYKAQPCNENQEAPPQLKFDPNKEAPPD